MKNVLIGELKKFYKKNKRDLPWRKTRDPYKILVSEVMLQQTQVERVIPYYTQWIKRFPTAQKLAAAKLAEVLKLWQGLGYNRRAKFLHQAAKMIVEKGWQEKLPGVGPYTRAAVEAFAYNKPGVFIETNIRTVFTHFYFKDKEGVADSQLLPLIERDFKKSKMQPRDYYAALMDYGSYLKSTGVKINKQSKHYVKQKKFKGSDRELRGALLRELLKEPQTSVQISKTFPHAKEKAAQLLAQLVAEGLLKKRGSRFCVAD